MVDHIPVGILDLGHSRHVEAAVAVDELAAVRRHVNHMPAALGREPLGPAGQKSLEAHLEQVVLYRGDLG